MPGDWTLGLDWPTCGINNQKCPSYLSRCDLCEKNKNLEEGTTEMIADKSWSIVTNDIVKAKIIIETIKAMCDKGTILREIVSRNTLILELSDGTSIRWWRCSESLRGMKCSKLWCDEQISKDMFENMIEVNYFGKRENIIWI